MKVEWVAELTAGSTTYYWSTKDTTWDGTSYSGVIIPDSLAGVTERRASETGVINPSRMSFAIHTREDPLQDTTGDYILDISGDQILAVGPLWGDSLVDGTLTLRQIVDDTQVNVWTWHVTRGETSYGKTTIYAESFISAFLRGNHPNTRPPREVFPSTEAEEERDDNYVIPIVFGDAYIPTRPVNPGSGRKYVLGKDDYTYSITKVRSPKEWKYDEEWASASYTMTQSVESGYQCLEPIIHDSDGDGTADATGIWPNGQLLHDMPCRFTSTQISSSANVPPTDVIAHVLEDFGIPATRIDTGTGSTFESTATQLATWGIVWNGGFYRQIARDRRFNNLLRQSNCSARATDKVELHPRSSTSQFTFDNSHIVRNSFRYNATEPKNADGGYVRFVPDLDTPQDRPKKILCVSQVGQTNVTQPDSEVLDCVYVHDSQIAQKLGTLFFNVKLDKQGTVSFLADPEVDKSIYDLKSDDVVTLSHELYGKQRNVLITEITWLRNGLVKIQAIDLRNGILDWNDLSPGAVAIVSASPAGFDMVKQTIDTGVDTSGEVRLQDGVGTIKAGITATGTGDDNVRIWAGDTYANRASAPFRVTQGGILYANGAIIDGDYKTDPDVGSTQSGIHLSKVDNAMYVWGDVGNGNIERLVSIGPSSSSAGVLDIQTGVRAALNIETDGGNDSATIQNAGDASALYVSSKNTFSYTATFISDYDGCDAVNAINLGTNGNYAGYFVGNFYCTDDVSALSFTDRTPHFEGDAIAELRKIKGKNGQIDHSTLPAFAQRQTTIPEWRTVPVKKDKPDGPKKQLKKNIPAPGRDLGAMVSILTVAVQQLTERLEVLENGSTTR